jgi:DUF4097 and DUF4098 domain-containing protein YvlB
MATRYAVPAGARLKVLTVSGNVRVFAEDRADIEIDPPDRRLETSDDGHVMETRTRSTNLTIRVPAGLNVSVGTVSGHVEMTGRFGTIKASSVSGQVKIGDTEGDADIRSISGHIEVGDCRGRCRANTKSGHIVVAHVAHALKATTMSGSIEAGISGADDVEIKSISGRITVRVDPGHQPQARLRSLSGKVRCECTQGGDFSLNASTISGSIEVQER